LVTASVMPNPRASPCTKVVLPAPRSPWRASVTSAGSSAVKAAASSWVSAAEPVATPARSLAEMLIAMKVPRPDQIVAKVRPPGKGAGGAPSGGLKSPDPAEQRLRKAAPPRTLEGAGIGPPAEGEQEFIILALAQRRLLGSAEAKGQSIDRELGPGAGRDQRAQILEEAVAHIHHRPDLVPAGQPGPFGQAGGKGVVVPAGEAAAQGA